MKKFLKLISNKKAQYWILTLLIAIISAGLIYAKLNQIMPQSTVFFLNDVSAPQKDQTVLVFSPHPDDESLGTGGYIIRSVENGAKIKIVLVTDGNKHGLKDKRYQEFRTATNTLGVTEDNLVFLNYPDGKLSSQNQNELYNKFKEVIISDNPNVVIFPHIQDSHPDHATTGKVVEKILQDLGKENIGYQYLVHDEHFPQPKKYSPDSYLLPPVDMVSFDKEWQRLILNKEEENRKQNAVESYKSQFKTPFLKRLMFSMIRKNEIYSITGGGK